MARHLEAGDRVQTTIELNLGAYQIDPGIVGVVSEIEKKYDGLGIYVYRYKVRFVVRLGDVMKMRFLWSFEMDAVERKNRKYPYGLKRPDR